jgi:hypothetical protein
LKALTLDLEPKLDRGRKAANRATNRFIKGFVEEEKPIGQLLLEEGARVKARVAQEFTEDADQINQHVNPEHVERQEE